MKPFDCSKAFIPSLISLYELCGADLIFGYCGVNPITDYYDNTIIPAASAMLFESYEYILKPLLNLVLTYIEPMLLALCSFTPLDLIIPGISITAATAALVTLRIIINDAGRLVSELLTWYSTYSKSETEILQIFYGSKVAEYSIFNFAEFKTALANRRQAIICFWNSANENGLPKIEDGAHYIYIHAVERNGIIGSTYQSRNGYDDYERYYAQNIENCFGYTKQSEQFIWGYILGA